MKFSVLVNVALVVCTAVGIIWVVFWLYLVREVSDVEDEGDSEYSPPPHGVEEPIDAEGRKWDRP